MNSTSNPQSLGTCCKCGYALYAGVVHLCPTAPVYHTPSGTVINPPAPVVPVTFTVDESAELKILREQLATLREENDRLKEENTLNYTLRCKHWERSDSAERRVAEMEEALKRFVENRHIIMPAIAGRDSFKRYFDAARTLLEADRKLRGKE